MTIFEMLEKLETEIGSLQARYQDLASALHSTAANRNGKAAPSKRKRSAAGSKKTVKTAAKKATAKKSARPNLPDFEQLELHVQENTEQPDQQAPRALGKRQALGKSIVQLRKMSAWRTNRADEE